MDFAPEYHYYTSDIARIWPVNGKYSPPQRELLQFVLDYRNAVLTRIRPGVTPRAIQRRGEGRDGGGLPAHQVLQADLRAGGAPAGRHRRRGLLAPGRHGRPRRRRYTGGVLKPGHVFSIDPQLRVPEEHIYLRYEDVIVITEKGYENFTDFLPSELDEIEKLVGQGGMLQAFPRRRTGIPIGG